MKNIKINLLRFKGKQSLRNRTISVVKHKYRGLHNNKFNKVNYIKSQVSSHWFFLIIIPLMIILTSVCFIDLNIIDLIGLDFLHIKLIERNLALGLLDARINNIIAITSVSLTVIGFLFTNMSQKNKDSYNMLFKLSYFFAILYYSLTTSAILILMSTYRNSYEEWQLMNISLLAVMFILFEFLFIGFLFSRIIMFTDPDSIYKYSKEKFLDSVQRFIYDEKITHESKVIVESIFSRAGKRVASLYGSRFKNKLYIISKLPESVIIDINVSAIEKCILNISNNENGDQMEFVPFGLNQGLLKGFDHNYANLSENIFQHNTVQNTLSEYIFLASPKKENIGLHEMNESLYNKTISAIQTNNIETIKHNLEIYDSLYNLYFENFS